MSGNDICEHCKHFHHCGEYADPADYDDCLYAQLENDHVKELLEVLAENQEGLLNDEYVFNNERLFIMLSYYFGEVAYEMSRTINDEMEIEELKKKLIRLVSVAVQWLGRINDQK